MMRYHALNNSVISERMCAKRMINNEPDYDSMDRTNAIEQYRRLRLRYIDRLLQIAFLKNKIEKLLTGKTNLKVIRENIEAIEKTRLNRLMGEEIRKQNELNKREWDEYEKVYNEQQKELEDKNDENNTHTEG